MQRLTSSLFVNSIKGLVKRCIIVFSLVLKVSFGMTLALPFSGSLVGEREYILSQEGDTLSEVGIRYGIGFREMVRANPSVDPDGYLSSKHRILIPSRFILPHVPRQGVVIDLAQFRLFYYPENDNVVHTYPIGIGRKGWGTPQGVTKIVAKQRYPKWRPTAKIRAHALRNGFDMPEEFPPGLSPLGKHAFRLGWPGYLIHGTNHVEGIGDRVSAGCIRMLPEDIEYLFERIKVGTQVRIVNEKLPVG
jgi:L,D-transpeptidase ErfK/SrfK